MTVSLLFEKGLCAALFQLPSKSKAVSYQKKQQTFFKKYLLRDPTGICFKGTSFYYLQNDLPNCLTFTTALYADDMHLCLFDKNLNDLQFSLKL